MTFRFSLIPASMAAVVLALLILLPSSMAADEEESKRLIAAYTDALGTNDLELIKTAWNDLNNSPESVEYMKTNMPQLHYMYQVRGLYFQVDAIDIGEGQGAVKEDNKAAVPEADAPAVEETKAQIEPFSVSAPGTGRPLTNGEIAERAKNTVLRDNRDIAVGNPNQNRQDNRTLIQNRSQAYYEQKFQEAPKALVPTGTEEGPLP